MALTEFNYSFKAAAKARLEEEQRRQNRPPVLSMRGGLATAFPELGRLHFVAESNRCADHAGNENPKDGEPHV